MPAQNGHAASLRCVLYRVLRRTLSYQGGRNEPYTFGAHIAAHERNRQVAKVLQETPDNKKGRPFRIALLDRPAERILFGRRDWTRTNDPHHVKVVL